MNNDYYLSQKVLECAFRVHTELGPGLLESVYQTCLAYDMTKHGLYVEKEKMLPVLYKGVQMDCCYRVDILVESSLILEIKSVADIAPIHLAQTISYLKLANLKHGLLLNFNVKSLKQGIRRVVDSEDRAWYASQEAGE